VIDCCLFSLEFSIVCWVPSKHPGLAVIAVLIKEGTELKVMKGMGSIKRLEWILWIIPALVRD
jgi:hypothetical protein